MTIPLGQADFASGPALLSQAGQTYQLAEDIVTLGPAFLLAAAGVALDGAGHTVTYDSQSPPPQPENGDFGSGDLTGWTLTGGTPTVAPAPIGVQTANALTLTGPGPYVLTSSPVAGLTPGVLHVASVVVKGDGSSTLTVGDTVTGITLGTAKLNSTGRGFALVAPFTASVNPVQLVLTITPPKSGKPTLVADALLHYSHQYGLIASSSVWYLSGLLTLTASQLLAAKGAKGPFTVTNLSLVQGQGNSYGGSQVYANSLAGLTLNGLSGQIGGMDTAFLDGSATSNPTVENCNLVSVSQRISNRMLLPAGLYFAKVTGQALLRNNVLAGCPCYGMAVLGTSGGLTALIQGNAITQAARYTDGYGISLVGAIAFDISRNLINGTGRGIILDGWSSQPTQNGTVTGNVVSVRENANLEYDASGLECTAFRMRNSLPTGVFKNITVSNNVFEAYTDDAGVHMAMGGRLTLHLSSLTSMADAGLVFENNTFRGIVKSTDPKKNAAALSIAALDDTIHPSFTGNRLESNDRNLILGDPDSWQAPLTGLVFTQNIFAAPAGYPQRAGAIPLLVGWGQNRVTVTLVDTQAPLPVVPSFYYPNLGSVVTISTDYAG